MAAERPVAAGQPMAAPNMRAARISSALFATAGAVMVIGGVASILTGMPSAAHDLVPLTGPDDLAGRFGQVAPIMSAATAAAVAVVVSALVTLRRLAPLAGSIELLVLGLVTEVCIGGAVGRIGHAADGGVMGATVVAMMGGSAVVAAGVIAVLDRE